VSVGRQEDAQALQGSAVQVAVSPTGIPEHEAADHHRPYGDAVIVSSVYAACCGDGEGDGEAHGEAEGIAHGLQHGQGEKQAFLRSERPDNGPEGEES